MLPAAPRRSTRLRGMPPLIEPRRSSKLRNASPIAEPVVAAVGQEQAAPAGGIAAPATSVPDKLELLSALLHAVVIVVVVEGLLAIALIQSDMFVAPRLGAMIAWRLILLIMGGVALTGIGYMRHARRLVK